LLITDEHPDSTVSGTALIHFPEGSNDGMVLLSDMILPGGITLTKIRSDHFLMDQHLDVTSVALTTAVIRWLENLSDGTSRVP
jgi:hypothetical protein